MLEAGQQRRRFQGSPMVLCGSRAVPGAAVTELGGSILGHPELTHPAFGDAGPADVRERA